MNTAMFAFLGMPEIVVIFLVLLAMALMAATAALLFVWLLRRHEGETAASPPQPEVAQTPSTSVTACPRCGAPMPVNSPQGLCPRCVMGVGLATQTEASGQFGPHGTSVLKPVPTSEEIAKHFPQLEILECLGRGGMGVVYKARQPKLNRLIALKILAPEKGAEPKFAERFQREAQALARLNHPNIVTIHDFGEADGMFFLLMEFVDGMTLRHLLREGHMKPEQALVIVPRICEALQFAHEQGIVHRDIKPENVLLDKQGRVKIADFGIAKIVGETPLAPSEGARGLAGTGEASLTQDHVLGTPNYMAPEQVEKPQLVDHRADIYSLGVVFYEMLTGELPLGKFQPPSKKVQVDVRLDEVVLHALEKEPGRRYQHASQVQSDVETIATTPGAPTAAGKPATAVYIKRWRDLWPWDMGYLALFVIVPVIAASILVLILSPHWGLKALWLFAFELMGIGFAATYAWVGQRIRRLRATLPRATGEVAEGLVLRRPFQSPGLAVLHEDRLELIPIVSAPTTVMLEDIVAVSEVRWFNGRRLWWKKGFVLELADGQRVGVAVAEPFARRWRSRLSRGTLPEIPPNSEPVESLATKIVRRQVQAPAVAMLITVVLNYLLLVGLSEIAGHGIPRLPFLLGAGAMHAFVMLGAVQMWRGKTYGLAVAAGILVMILAPVCVLGFPLGIWVLVVLRRREVRELFGILQPMSPQESRQSSPGGGAWKVAAVVAAAVMILLAIPVGAMFLSITLKYLARQRALVTAYDPDRVAGVEQKLTQAVEARLRTAHYRFDSVFVNVVSAKYDQAECLIEGLQREVGDNLFEAVTGKLEVQHIGNGLWSFVGTDGLSRMKFHVDAAAEMGPPRVLAPDTIFRYPAPEAADSNGLAAVKVMSDFGPVIERVVDDASTATNYLIDLDTGRLFTPPADLKPGDGTGDAKVWYVRNGIDAMGNTKPGIEGLVGVDVFVLPVSNDRWNSITHADWEALRSANTEWRVEAMPGAGSLPATFLFKTREGGIGILQILGLNFNPLGVRIRYKLLQPAHPTPTSFNAGFGPVIERVVNGSGAEAGNQGLNFRSGALVSIPERELDNNELRMQWITNHAVDLLVVNKGGAKWNLVGPELKVARLAEGQWDQATPEELRRALAAVVMDTEDGWPFHAIHDRLEQPLTFAFQAGSGTIGLLQLTGFTEKPRGVKLRYKVVQEDVSLMPGVTASAGERFGPEKEVRLTEFNNMDGQEALDLDTSTVFKQPKDMDHWSEEELGQWVKENGVDLFVDHGPGGVWGLLTTTDAELRLARVEDDKWGVISEGELAPLLAGNSTPLQIATQGRLKVYVPPKETQPPMTFAFKTSSGGVGILQITGFTDDPRGVRLRYKLVQESRSSNVAGLVQAPIGQYSLALPNGVFCEIVAVTRNPAANKLWWKPDGTPLPEPPGAQLSFIPSGMNRQMPNGDNDHAIWVRLTPPALSLTQARWQSRVRYSPPGERLGLVDIHADSRAMETMAALERLGRKLTGQPGGPKTSGTVVGRADALRFPSGMQEVAVQCETALGPWEALAVFDGRQTKVLVEGVQVLCTHLRQEANGKCLDVTHNVDRGRFALRMMAVFKDGKREEVGLHSGVLSARETQGYVMLEPGQRIEDIADFVLERSPWVCGEIRGIALKPRASSVVPPERYGKPPFGPVMERTLKGWNETRTNCFIDFESGQVLDAPANLAMTNRAAVWEWAKAQGVDAVAMTTEEIRGLLGYELTVGPLRDDDWETVTSQDVSKALTQAAFDAQKFPGQDPLAQFVMTVNTVSTSTNQPRTYAFRTREGNSGWLQFLSYTDAPGGSVTIRYKLVLSASTGTATPAPQSDTVKEMAVQLPIKAGGLDQSSQFTATLPGVELGTAKLHFHEGTARTRLMLGLRFTSQSVRSARLEVALLDSSASDAKPIHRFTHVEEVGPEEVRSKGHNLDSVRRWDSSRALWFDVPIEARKAQAIQIKVQLQQDTPEEKSAVRQRPDRYRKQRLLAESMKNLKLDQTYVPGEKVELVLATNEATRLEFAHNAAGVSAFMFQYEPDGLNVFYNSEGEDHDWIVLTTKRTTDSRNISKTGAQVWMKCVTEWRLENGKAHVTFLAKLLPEEQVKQIKDEQARRDQQRLEALRRVLEWEENQTVAPFRIVIPTQEDPDLTALRTQYDLEKVVAGAADDYEQLQRLVKWAHDRWEHTGDNTPSKSDPLTILAEAAQGRRFRCVEYATVVAGCAQALGMPARALALKRADVETAQAGAGHLVAEVWLKSRNKWVFADGQWDAIPEKDGVPLNAVEFQDAFAHNELGLTIRSMSNTDRDAYLRWVVPYLYYFDFNLNQDLFGTSSSPAEKGRSDSARGSIMLVPKGDKNPKVFQRTTPIRNCTYISSPRAFYAAPTTRTP